MTTTTITTAPGMTLNDIAFAVYRVAPDGIDFTRTPDGNITFTDTQRPGEEFRVGPDTVYAGDDIDGVVWAEWTRDTDGSSWEASAADGCSISDPADLVAALTAWVDR